MPIDRQDAARIEDLYDDHGVSCYQLAHRMVHEEQLASAIVRDVFLAVWRGEVVFDPARGSVQSWLLSATHRRAVATLRSQRQLSIRREIGLEMPQELPTLAAVQLNVLELAYLGGYTETEIAAFTRVTLSMAKTLTLQALRGMCARPSTLA